MLDFLLNKMLAINSLKSEPELKLHRVLDKKKSFSFLHKAVTLVVTTLIRDLKYTLNVNMISYFFHEKKQIIEQILSYGFSFSFLRSHDSHR